VNEIEKIEYRILELQTKMITLPEAQKEYAKGYLDALQDTIRLLKRDSGTKN